MRFVHVNHRYAPFIGGSERYVQEVSEALVRASHDVQVITSNAFDLEHFWDRRAQQVDAPEHDCINGVAVRRVPVHHMPANGVIFQGSRRLMGEASRVGVLPSAVFEAVSRTLPRMPGLSSAVASAFPADMVHVTNLSLEGPGLVASEVAMQHDVPLVLTPFIHIGRDDDPVARRYVSMPHQKTLLDRATAVVVMTQIERSFLVSLGIEPNRIFVSGVGIYPAQVTGGNADRFRERYGIHGTLIGVASAVAFDKGSRELVLAVRDLRRRGHDVTLVLAGPRLRHFDDWFASLPEHDRVGVVLPGFISESEKRDMLAALDILAMPSRTESFGIAYLEGWANSKPVIAARAGAVPELVRDGETGILVEFGDVAAITESILQLLSNPEDASRMASAGRQMTLEQFTWPNVVGRVMRAYEFALGHPVTELEGGSSGPA